MTPRASRDDSSGGSTIALDDRVGRKIAAVTDVFEQRGSNDRRGDELRRRCVTA